MEKTIKRAGSVIVSIFLITSMMVGCQKSTTSESDETKKQVTEASQKVATPSKSAKPVVLKAVLNVPAEVKLANNPVLKKAFEATNIELDIEAPPQNDYWNRTRIIVASGDYPDIMLQGTDVDMEKWAEEGILAVLDDKVKNYPNLMANISPQQWSDARALSTGKIVAVPRPNSYDRDGYVINQKWLDNLGLKAPETVAEYIKVCRAFTFDDPDKNGKDDTVGVTFASTTGQNPIFSLTTDFLSTAYNLSSVHWGMPDVDGTFHTRATSSLFYDYLNLFRDMYKEGILDREIITNKEKAGAEGLSENRIGISSASEKSYIYEYITKFNRDLGDITFHAPLKLTENSTPYYADAPSCWCAFHIFAKSDKIDDSLRFLDYANSEEGFKLFQFGLEGVHYSSYDIGNRTINRTPEQIASQVTVTGGWFNFANAYLQQPPLVGGENDKEREKWNKETKAASKVTTQLYFPFVKQMYKLEVELPDEKRTLDSLMIQYITSEINLDKIKKFIDEEYAPKVKPYEELYSEFMKKNPVTSVKLN